MADQGNRLRPPVDKHKRAQSLNNDGASQSFSRQSMRSNVSSLDGRKHILKRPPMKIVTYKLDFLKNAKAKVHTFENINYKPGGGNVNYDETEIGWDGDTDLGGQLDFDASQNPVVQTNRTGNFDHNAPKQANFDAARPNKEAPGQASRRNETGEKNGNKPGGAKSFYVDEKDGATVKITVIDDSKRERRPANVEPSSKSSEIGQSKRPRRFSKFGEESQNSGDADGDTTKLPLINGERDSRNARPRRAPSPEVSRNPAPGRNDNGNRDGGRRPSAKGAERDPNETRARGRRPKAGDGQSETNRDAAPPKARRRDLSENTGARKNFDDQQMGESVDSADSDTTLVFASSPQTAKSRNDRGDNADRLRRLAASDANVYQRGQDDGRDEKRGEEFAFAQNRNGQPRNEFDSQGQAPENAQNGYRAQNERYLAAPAGQNGYVMQNENGQNRTNEPTWQGPAPGQTRQNGPKLQAPKGQGPNWQGQNAPEPYWQNGQTEQGQNGQNRYNGQAGYGRQDPQFGNNGNPGPGRYNETRQSRFDEPSDRSYDGQAYGDFPSASVNVNQFANGGGAGGGGVFMASAKARNGPGPARFAPQTIGIPAGDAGEKVPLRIPANQFEVDQYGVSDAVPPDNDDTRTRTAFGEFTGTLYAASRMGKSRATLSSDEPPEPKKIGIVEKIDFSKGKEAVVFKFEKRLKTRLPRVAYLAHASDPGPKKWNVLPRADKTQMRKDKVPINYSTLHDQSVLERQQYEQYVTAKQLPPPNLTSRVTGRESMLQTSRATSRNEKDVYYLNLPSKGFNGQLFLPPIDQPPNAVYNAPPTRMSVPNQLYGNTSQSSPIPEHANDDQYANSNQVYQYASVPNVADRVRGDPRTGGADLAAQHERSVKYDQARYVEGSRPVATQSDQFVSQSKPITDEDHRAMQRRAQANWTRNDQDDEYTQVQTQIVGRPLANDNEEFAQIAARRAQSFGENDSRKVVLMSDKETETEMDNAIDVKKTRNNSALKPSANYGMSETARPKMSSMETQTSANEERRRSRSTEAVDEGVQLDSTTTSVVNRNRQATVPKQLPVDDTQTTKTVINSEVSQVPRQREKPFANNQRPSQIEITNAPPTFLTDGSTNYVVAYANMSVSQNDENKPPNNSTDQLTVEAKASTSDSDSGSNNLKQTSEQGASEVLSSQKQTDSRKSAQLGPSTGPIKQSTTTSKIDELMNRMRKLKNSNTGKSTDDAAAVNTATKDQKQASRQNTIPEKSTALLPGRSPSITDSEKQKYSTVQMLINYRPPPTSVFTGVTAPQTSEYVPDLHANSDLHIHSHSVDMPNIGSSYRDVDQASIAPTVNTTSTVSRSKPGFADIHASRRASLQSTTRRSSVVYLFD